MRRRRNPGMIDQLLPLAVLGLGAYWLYGHRDLLFPPPPPGDCKCADGTPCPGGVLANCTVPSTCKCPDGTACPGGVLTNCQHPRSGMITGKVQTGTTGVVVGIGTLFVTELSPGERIRFGGGMITFDRVVLGITDNTHMTVDAIPPASAIFTVTRLN